MNKTSFKINSRTIFICLVSGCGIVLLTIGAVYLTAFLLGPPDLSHDQNTIYYSSEGEIFGEERGNESRYDVDLEAMSPYLIEATLMIEDKRFYQHKGLDFKRIIGAVISDLKNKSLKEGGSTLTQQYARNLYLSHEKTWTRKVKEAFYALRIELFYSKQDILKGYLNTIYYGHGAYGIEAASQYYFNKSAQKLSLAEAAMLAGIPKGPVYYSPFAHSDNADNRQQHILKQLLKQNKITHDEYAIASKETLQLADTNEENTDELAPYYQDVVLDEAAHILNMDRELIRSGGFEIYTTLKIPIQENLERQVNQSLDTASDIEASAIMMRPQDGAIQALIGGRDYEESPFNRAIKAKRMPGSTFKPFLYYAALENGYTASTLMESKPTAFELSNGEVYQPSNFNDYYANQPITLAQAIALSDNIYAVKTHLYLGTETLVKTLKNDFNMEKDFPAVASLALGTAEVTMEDMVTGYAMLANGGKEIESYTIDKIVDKMGNELYSRPSQPAKEKLNPQTAFILTDLLTGMFDEELNGYAPVTGSPITHQLTHNFAGKSGTTTTDSWMIGYNPSNVTGVWLGYDNNETLENISEIAAAKEIWADVMEDAAREEVTSFEAPSGVVGVPVDPETGALATPYCDTSRVMYFKKGEEPQQHCPLHFNDQDESDSPNEDKEEEKQFEKWFNFFNP